VPSALLKIGDGYYNLKRYAQAAQSYSHVVRAYPKSKEAPEADYGILLCLLQERKYDSFISQVETFLKRYPQHALAAQALMQLGDTYQQERMKRECRQDLSRAHQSLYPNQRVGGGGPVPYCPSVYEGWKMGGSHRGDEPGDSSFSKSHLAIEARVELMSGIARTARPTRLRGERVRPEAVRRSPTAWNGSFGVRVAEGHDPRHVGAADVVVVSSGREARTTPRWPRRGGARSR